MAGGETHQVVWDSLLDYGRLEWQSTLIDFFNLFFWGGGHQMLLMRTFLNNLIMFGESTVVLLRKNVVVM